MTYFLSISGTYKSARGKIASNLLLAMRGHLDDIHFSVSVIIFLGHNILIMFTYDICTSHIHRHSKIGELNSASSSFRTNMHNIHNAAVKRREKCDHALDATKHI